MSAVWKGLDLFWQALAWLIVAIIVTIEALVKLVMVLVGIITTCWLIYSCGYLTQRLFDPASAELGFSGWMCIIWVSICALCLLGNLVAFYEGLDTDVPYRLSNDDALMLKMIGYPTYIAYIMLIAPGLYYRHATRPENSKRT